MNLFHGSNENSDFSAHRGVCLTDSKLSAEEYGANVFPVSFDLSGLTVLNVTDLVDRDNMSWPGDRASDIAAYEAQGIDVLFFSDETSMGREHDTWRIVSAKALLVLA